MATPDKDMNIFRLTNTPMPITFCSYAYYYLIISAAAAHICFVGLMNLGVRLYSLDWTGLDWTSWSHENTYCTCAITLHVRLL